MIKKLIERLRAKALQMVFFMILFVFVGFMLPDVYYKYIDQTQYLIIDSPALTDKTTYKSCDTMQLFIHRKALFDLQVQSLKSLVLVLNTGSQREVAYTVLEAPVPQGEENLQSQVQLPCNLDNGTYFWRGNVSYEVHGYEKVSAWYSVNFMIKN